MGKGALLLSLALSLSLMANGDPEPRETWVSDGFLTSAAKESLGRIRDDVTLVCGKERYRLDEIARLSKRAPYDETSARKLREAVSAAIERYRHDTAYGCLDPKAVYPEHLGIDPAIRRMPHGGKNPVLEGLEEALRRYLRIAREGGWKRVKADFRLLEPGDRDPAVPAIADRLKVTGDLNASFEANATYVPDLAEAVTRFQRRHGLKADGIIGPNTLRAMNEPVAAKVRRLRINLERVRWMVNDARDFVLANIPDFSLTLYRGGEPELSMKTVVGSRMRPTPMLADTLTYAVLNPVWRAPETIVEKDILPKLKAGRFDELARKGIVAVRGDDANESVDWRAVDWSRYTAKNLPYIFMQKPGPLNYLGFVKFMFPNDFDVYLHDTNHDDYFAYRNRAKSSGCIRLEKPLELFHALFDPYDTGEWRYKRIAGVLVERNERLVGLKWPLPVYILYLTAFEDEEGSVQFRPDIYGYDKKMNDFLNQFERP
jgi:murein L,D-transpeptidase YcbB/YkuD